MGSGQRATGWQGSELPVEESYEQQWAGPATEASGSELLVHGFVQKVTSFIELSKT